MDGRGAHEVLARPRALRQEVDQGRGHRGVAHHRPGPQPRPEVLSEAGEGPDVDRRARSFRSERRCFRKRQESLCPRRGQGVVGRAHRLAAAKDRTAACPRQVETRDQGPRAAARHSHGLPPLSASPRDRTRQGLRGRTRGRHLQVPHPSRSRDHDGSSGMVPERRDARGLAGRRRHRRLARGPGRRPPRRRRPWRVRVGPGRLRRRRQRKLLLRTSASRAGRDARGGRRSRRGDRLSPFGLFGGGGRSKHNGAASEENEDQAEAARQKDREDKNQAADVEKGVVGAAPAARGRRRPAPLLLLRRPLQRRHGPRRPQTRSLRGLRLRLRRRRPLLRRRRPLPRRRLPHPLPLRTRLMDRRGASFFVLVSFFLSFVTLRLLPSSLRSFVRS
mmetsp:Transcript_25826/g.79470  ORF Transcript_25826/g.79470 Transcript_25826/m.79470 type:complete len:390 (-) Transcript_25826:228-1397(-)